MHLVRIVYIIVYVIRPQVCSFGPGCSGEDLGSFLVGRLHFSSSQNEQESSLEPLGATEGANT